MKDSLSAISLYTLLPPKLKVSRISIDDPSVARPKEKFIPKDKLVYNSKFTGREREMSFLKTLYSELSLRIKKASKENSPTYKPIVAGISGDPGIGKSRLADELVRRLQQSLNISQNTFWKAYNTGLKQDRYSPFIQFVRNIACIKDGAAISEFSNKIKSEYTKLSNESISMLSKFSVLRNNKNRNITKDSQALLHNSLKELIFSATYKANTEGFPLVLIIEDLQWADESTLLMIEYLLRSVNLQTEGAQPQILFLFTYRKSFRPSKTIREESDYRNIVLEELREEDSEKIIRSILTDKAIIKPETIEAIKERADGNPFNIEEWCSHIKSKKGLEAIPGNVKFLLMEKVARLSKEERIVLKIASVSGRRFNSAVITEIARRAEEKSDTGRIMELLQEDRFVKHLSGEEYEFRHDILHESIYSAMKPRMRRLIHELAGESIEKLYTKSLAEHYYELADHYEKAGNEEKTKLYLEKAGDKAKDNYENERAIKYYGKLLKRNFTDEHKIIFKLCDVYMNKSDWKKQIELCEILRKTTKDILVKAECYKRIGDSNRNLAEYSKAKICYKQGKTSFGRAMNTFGCLEMEERNYSLLLSKGHFVKALNCYQRFKHNSVILRTPLYKKCILAIGLLSTKTGDFENSIRYNNMLAAICIRDKDLTYLLKSKINKGEALYFLDHQQLALNTFLEGAAIADRIQDKTSKILCLGNIGALNQKQGAFGNALKYFTKCLEENLKRADKVGIARSYGYLGGISIALNDFHSANRFLKLQLKLSIELGRKQNIANCVGNIGIVYSQIGQYELAKTYYIKQISLCEKEKLWEGLARARINLGILYKDMKKRKQALKLFEDCLRIVKTFRIENIKSILFPYYSEILYEVTEFRKAIEYANQAELLNKAEENNLLRLHSMAIGVKAKLKMLIKNLSKSPIDIEQVALRNLLKFERQLVKCKKEEEFALTYFELCKMSEIVPYLRQRVIQQKYMNKSFEIYSKLYKNSKKIEYLRRIEYIADFTKATLK